MYIERASEQQYNMLYLSLSFDINLVLNLKPTECRTTVMMPRTRLLSLTWLIVIIVAVILFIGIVLLALLRLLFFIQDKREFAKFEKERKDASWSNVSLYKSM